MPNPNLNKLADDIEEWFKWFGQPYFFATPIRLAERLLERGYRMPEAKEAPPTLEEIIKLGEESLKHHHPALHEQLIARRGRSIRSA